MRTKHFIPVVLLAAVVACNSTSDKTTTTDTATAAAQDTSMNSMKHDSVSSSVTPLPAVPAGAKVFFINLKNGQTVKSPLKVEFGVAGIQLDTAGPIVAGSGHHHLLVDAGDSLAAGTVVPKDATHYHYGKAQKEATITLTPGKHRLALQYGDGIHRSYGAQLAKAITVTVK
ncbi:MAG TPA: DUF4399 domain-containing protein [Puia sp.]|nr:DUF4399 domain-containing protein [Puia sp.]